MPSDSYQLSDIDAISDALDRSEVTLLLAAHAGLNAAEQAVLDRAETADIPVRRTSDNDLRRMSRTRPPAAILALVGRPPSRTLEQLMAAGGPVWLLAGVTYPSNAGSLIRTLEVAGAQGVVVAAQFTRAERIRALRISMHAERFMPVLWFDAETTIANARAAGRRIYAVEDSGSQAPWDVDLTAPTLLILGGERDGLTPELLTAADAVLRLPMPGFIGSYNVQAAASAVAVERLRQRASK